MRMRKSIFECNMCSKQLNENATTVDAGSGYFTLVHTWNPWEKHFCGADCLFEYANNIKDE